MTNEELAVMIQGGQADLVPTLWEQVERFVAKQAHRWFLNNRRRVEFDDLYQSGFLAMMEAVRTFDPEGGSSFLSWMGNNHLKTAFMAALGARTEKQRQDPLHTAASLDAPLQVDEDLTIGDMVQDPVDCMAKADRRIWLEQLHDELDHALDTLPAEQRTALRQRFYHGMTFAEAAALAGEKPDTIRKWESAGLNKLRRGKQAARLRAFVDARTLFYAARGVHGVEYVVLKREQIANSHTEQDFR